MQPYQTYRNVTVLSEEECTWYMHLMSSSTNKPGCVALKKLCYFTKNNLLLVIQMCLISKC